MEETYSDIFKFNLKSSNSSRVLYQQQNQPVDALQVQPKKEDNMEANNNVKPKPTSDLDSPYYDMSGQKRMIIFNHFQYMATRYYRFSAPPQRNGTEKDVARLKSVFGELLGFDIDIYDDMEYENIWEILTRLSKEDLSALSCISLAILTHGSYDGELYAADRGYYLRDVVKLFQNNLTLVNKPKLFFVQACRGKELDEGKRVTYTDGDASYSAYLFPTHADFLIMRSTVEDYVSFRDMRGSWLIQELCEAIENHYENQNILEIITNVNRRVATFYQSYTKDKKINEKKQMPETIFTLTKLLKLKVEE